MFEVKKYKLILQILMQSTIKIRDLQLMTEQSYEKSRQDFNLIKKGYVKECLDDKAKLPNSREIPLNDYTLGILELWYGINKNRIIENINLALKFSE